MMLFAKEIKQALERRNQIDRTHENFHQTKKY